MFKILSVLFLISCASSFSQETTPVKQSASKASPRVSQNSTWEPRYLKYQALKMTWMYRRGGLSEAEKEDLYNQYILAYREWREFKLR